MVCFLDYFILQSLNLVDCILCIAYFCISYSRDCHDHSSMCHFSHLPLSSVLHCQLQSAICFAIFYCNLNFSSPLSPWWLLIEDIIFCLDYWTSVIDDLGLLSCLFRCILQIALSKFSSHNFMLVYFFQLILFVSRIESKLLRRTCMTLCDLFFSCLYFCLAVSFYFSIRNYLLFL